MEAAQQSISSPLLDNVSISGATGVLINIMGGDDLTLGEATQISEIIHDAAGDEAEIIFGATTDPAMQGEIRVTVIATGFDKAVTGDTVTRQAGGAVLTFPTPRRHTTPVSPLPIPGKTVPKRPAAEAADSEISEMEIPTFIRRQMD